MDLQDRTLAALDWPVVLEALSRHARTTRGAVRARLPRLSQDLAEIEARYQVVVEIRDLEIVGERVPVGAVTDVEAELDKAGRGGALEAEELRAVGDSLQALRHLRTWVEEHPSELPRLRRLVLPIVVDGELAETLHRSFDDEGRLSEREYPELGALRRQVESLRSRIRRTLDELVRGEGMGDALQDRFITERDGRFVLPVRADRRKGLGIVHGRSQSGETVYVEPAAVVELHNELHDAEGDLHRETSRILGVLSRMVGRFRAPLLEALEAATRVDLAVARSLLGVELGGIVPRVGLDGVLDLRQGRHPVLALRGVPVIANDLRLDGAVPGLVLSGPNTGGKTVALKTLGLAALMVRSGIPVPCREGSRVDLFLPVVADIGDWQTVEGDLSTFSGHVAVLKAVLEAVAAGPALPPALVLLDELGMGTDPAQGAALARAVLEALVEGGARVAATTHYTELKALAAVDPRFQVAAVAIEDGRPTYQVILGAAGESHALAIASHLDLSEAVVGRARALLGAEQRDLSDLVGRLEEQRAQLSRQARSMAAAEAEALARLAALAEREARLEERRQELERRVSERFEARLRGRERELKELIAALQAQPELRMAGRTLDKVREALDEAKVPAPVLPSGLPPAVLAEGDTVIVRSLGRKARVLRLLKGDQVEVAAGPLKMKVARADLEGTRGERFDAPPPPPPPVQAAPPAARLRAASAAHGRFEGLRIEANTLDLRGERVEDALERLDHFLSELTGQGYEVGFILHGHGTGALKQAIRRALPGRRDVRRWRPADVGEGGDAYTLVELA